MKLFVIKLGKLQHDHIISEFGGVYVKKDTYLFDGLASGDGIKTGRWGFKMKAVWNNATEYYQCLVKINNNDYNVSLDLLFNK